MFSVGIRQIQSDQAIPLIINSYGNCISGKNELTIKQRKENKIMNKDKMILKDNTTIELEAGAYLTNIQVVAADRAGMVEIWKKMTDDNLSNVQIQTGDGLTIGTYTDLVLVSETSTVSPDGTVLTSYHLREKTDEEKRLDALEEGQTVQDGAISDLGSATSALADQIGGEQ